MALEERKETAPSAPPRRFRRPTVSVATTAMSEETQRRFEQLIVELVAKAVRDRLEQKEESHELPRTQGAPSHRHGAVLDP